MPTLQGQCLCKKVKVTLQSDTKHMGVCHCDMCRQWVGGPFFGVDCKETAQWSGQEHIRTFESSSWAQRGFCGHCGSALFYRFNGTERHFVAAGLLEDHASLIFHHEIFTDEQPACYAFANTTARYTSEEVIQLFAK